jgi:hypothetical protein
MQPSSGMVAPPRDIPSRVRYRRAFPRLTVRACPLGTAQQNGPGRRQPRAGLGAEIHCAAVSQPAGKLAHYMI